MKHLRRLVSSLLFVLPEGTWPSFLPDILSRAACWGRYELAIMWGAHTHNGHSAWLEYELMSCRFEPSNLAIELSPLSSLRIIIHERSSHSPHEYGLTGASNQDLPCSCLTPVALHFYILIRCCSEHSVSQLRISWPLTLNHCPRLQCFVLGFPVGSVPQKLGPRFTVRQLSSHKFSPCALP